MTALEKLEAVQRTLAEAMQTSADRAARIQDYMGQRTSFQLGVLWAITESAALDIASALRELREEATR